MSSNNMAVDRCTNDTAAGAIDFPAVWRMACECDAKLSEGEGRRLFELAQAAPEHVLEVGSLHGGSAVLLARAGAKHLSLIEPMARLHLLHSLAKHGLLHKVSLFTYPDYQVWPYWSEPISFMFLDHEHEYLAVRNSLLGWRRHLREGARIAIHDYVSFPAVKQGVDELAPALEIIEEVDNLVVAVWVP